MRDHRRARVAFIVPATFRRARRIARALLSAEASPACTADVLEPLDSFTYTLVLDGIASSGHAGALLERLASAGGDSAARFLAQLVRKTVHCALERPLGSVEPCTFDAVSLSLREAHLSAEARRLASVGL